MPNNGTHVQIKKFHQPTAIQRNGWNQKYKASNVNKPKEQRYRPRRQHLTHKLANVNF